MKALESLKSIFKDRIFKIPDYQRGYAWQKKQLVEFWEDIINLPSERFHYTGLLSLKEVPRSEYLNESWRAEKWLIEDMAYTPFHVVDGQQRLTTIIIFINELVDFVKHLPSNEGKEDSDIYLGVFSLKKIKEDYLVIKKPPEFMFNSYRFGYESDNPSFKYLKYKILGEETGERLEETFYTLNLDNAKKFFNDNIASYYEKFNTVGLEVLFKKITQNLMFNLHEIEDDFDVFVAFETMNNRGKRLSNLELLKNRLIYLTTLYTDREIDEDDRILLRNDINDAWKEVYMQLGRNKDKLLSDDDFLQAHWIMYFTYRRKKGDDYINYLLNEKFNPKSIFIKEDIILSSIQDTTEVKDDNFDDDTENEDLEPITPASELSPREIFDYVESLKVTAKHWYNSFNPMENNELTKDESLWIDRLNRIKISYFRPLVVASFLNEDITSEDRVKLFKEIERFLFLEFKMSTIRANYKSSEYYKYSRELITGEATIDDICSRLRETTEEDLNASKGFDISQFKTILSRLFKSYKGFYSWTGLQYFLYEYEQDKVLKDGNPKITWDLFVRNEKDKVSVEHIYPQTPTDDTWIVPFNKYNEEQKKILTGTLGNLLLLSQSKNSSMQNDSFEKKKKNGAKNHTGYVDGSHSEIEVSSYNKWEADEILNRGLKLLDFMEKRWDIKFKDENDKKEVLFLDFL